MDWHRIEWSEVCEKLETDTEKVSHIFNFALKDYEMNNSTINLGGISFICQK